MIKTEPMRIGKNFVTGDEQEYRYRHDYLTFYNKIFGNTMKVRKYPHYLTFCPFHADKKHPNLNINIISGHFICFACGKKGGPWEFMVVKNDNGQVLFNLPEELTDIEALRKMIVYDSEQESREAASELTLKIEENRAQQAHDFLFLQPLALQGLTRDRGLTIETIKQWKIGFMRGTPTIPIPDIMGKMSSLKFHKKYQTEGCVNQLFPWSALVRNRDPYVILVEGEFDMFILRQNGFNAVTQTSGAGSWNKSFTPYFRKKTVFIAYDNDEPGKKGAMAVGNEMWSNGISVMIIQWPEDMKKDHGDFFVKYKKTSADYKRLMQNAKSIINIRQGA